MPIGATTLTLSDTNWTRIFTPGEQYIITNKSGTSVQVALTATGDAPDALTKVYELGGVNSELVTVTDHYTWVKAALPNTTIRLRDIGTLDPLEDLTYVGQRMEEAHQKIDDHIGDTNNPHVVTKAQVGLGNLPNAVTDNPLVSDTQQLASAAAVAAASSITLNHIADKTNPHNTTKAQVGLDQVANYPPASEANAIDINCTTAYMTPATTAKHIEKLVFISSAVAPQTVVAGLVGALPDGWVPGDCSSPPIHTQAETTASVRIKAGLQVAYADRGKVRVSSTLRSDFTVPLHVMDIYNISAGAVAAPGTSIYLITGRTVYIFAEMDVDGNIKGFGCTDKAPKAGMAREGHLYDFFSVPECVMYDSGNTPVRRVYIAKVPGYEGVIGAVLPVPLGREYKLPITDTLALSNRYLYNNPFIDPIEPTAEVCYNNLWGQTRWNDQIGIIADVSPANPNDHIVIQCGQMGFLACGRESGSPFGNVFTTVTSPLRTRVRIKKKY